MKIRLTLDIDDDKRQIIAQRVTGRRVKRLATRVEVRELLEGLLSRYCDEASRAPEDTNPVRKITMTENGPIKLTEAQHTMRADFESLGYVVAGIGDGDLVMEKRGIGSMIRQRIAPNGLVRTCRTGSWVPIGSAKS